MPLLFSWLLSLCTDGDLARLGDPLFDVREGAEVRLRMAGLAAVPALLRGQASDDPEVRLACDRLLAPWRKRLLWARAAVVLTSPEPPDVAAFFTDEKLRRYTYRLAVAHGCGANEWVGKLDPDNDTWCWWSCNPPVVETAFALAACRTKLGVPTMPPVQP